MTPRLAPEARYRLIPHPVNGGFVGLILDEAAPLTGAKLDDLNQWVAGATHSVEHVGTTTAYATGGLPGDTYPTAILYRVNGELLAISPELDRLLKLPMVSHVAAADHCSGRRTHPGIFGFAADGTLVVGIAPLNPNRLAENGVAS